MFTHKILTTIAFFINKALRLSSCWLCSYFIFLALLPLQSIYAIPYSGSKMVVTGPSPYAAQTAEKIIAKGGNVVDVAVAMGLTLSVTSPYYAALGGGGFALISIKNNVEVLDFREVAPLKTSPSYFTENKKSSIDGGAAIGTPGFPAGLYEMHKKYGKLNWKILFDDALKLANQGFRVSGEWAEMTNSTKNRFNSAGAKFLFKKNNIPYKAGEQIKQPQLAKALNLLKKYGTKPFYHGVIATDLVGTVQAHGGPLTLEDLKRYQVKWRQPLSTKFLGYDIFLMPPPSSGGVVIKSALDLVEKTDLLTKSSPFSAEEYHILGEILSRAFRSRSLLGDPDFNNSDYTKLISNNFISTLLASIKWDKHSNMPPLDQIPSDSDETTHYSVMDIDGNAVTLTVTLNGRYGSGIVSNKYGIALNNEMDDFTTQPEKPNMFGLIQGDSNKVEPLKRPLSSMSPTLVQKEGKTILALGAPGGPRIISGVFQTLYRVLGRNMNIDSAIQSPRVHHQYLPDTLFIDQYFPHDAKTLLIKKGHIIEESWQGRVNGIQLLLPNKTLEAAFDMRGEGSNGGF